MSKVSREFARLVDTLDDAQLERKVKEMRETVARLSAEATFAGRVLKVRRAQSLRRARDGV